MLRTLHAVEKATFVFRVATASLLDWAHLFDEAALTKLSKTRYVLATAEQVSQEHSIFR